MLQSQILNLLHKRLVYAYRSFISDLLIVIKVISLIMLVGWSGNIAVAQQSTSTQSATAGEILSNTQNVPEPQNFGSWIKFCSLPAGTPTVLCKLMQSARPKDRPDISFRVSFFKNEQPEKFTMLRVIVPIHVELRLGVGIMIDGSQDMGNMPYSRCGGEECVAEAMLSDDDLAAFFNGKTATFYVFTTPEQGIGGIINLDGVREGYHSLP